MSAHKIPPQRIELAGSGLGEISEELIMQRALELAIADGRSHRNEKDILDAKRELFAASAGNATDKTTQSISMEWGSPPASTGKRGPQVHLEDDANMANELVREGLEEAERDTRTHSNDDIGRA